MIEIPKGPIKVHVQGEGYRQDILRRYPINKPQRFSLTPQNDYQKQQGWPEGKFYNVNTYISGETTYDNWLGYVLYEGKPTATEIAQLIYAGDVVSAWGYVEREDGDDNIVLTIPRSLQEQRRSPPPTSQRVPISPKSRTAALVLAILLGFLGAHRFYVGKTGTGILMLVTFGGAGIWWLIDIIMVAIGSLTDKAGLFVKKW
jgi:hypothetical protein